MFTVQKTARPGTRAIRALLSGDDAVYAVVGVNSEGQWWYDVTPEGCNRVAYDGGYATERAAKVAATAAAASDDYNLGARPVGPWIPIREGSRSRRARPGAAVSPRILHTYSTVTPESAEECDYADRGWIGPGGDRWSCASGDDSERRAAEAAGVEGAWSPDPDDDLVEATVAYLRSEGVYGVDGASVGQVGAFHEHDWWIARGGMDIYTGEEEERGYHPEGYPPAVLAEIDRRVRGAAGGAR
ncbi:MAG: hypothetical protein FJ090_23080 [Deltaproteobacteria bacterium]|nr:hypothetical protein [Deltaproteobacteria bacterium]